MRSPDDGHRRQGRPLLAALTVLISLSAVMLVPEPGVPLDGARDHARGDLRPRGDADAAPRGARRLGAEVDKLALPWAHSASTARRVRGVGGAPVAPPARLRTPRARRAGGARDPGHRLKTAMPSIKVVPVDRASRVGYTRSRPRSDRRARCSCRSWSRPLDAARSRPPPPTRHRACEPASPGEGLCAGPRPIPTDDPSTPAIGATIDRLRSELPAGVLVGGAARRTTICGAAVDLHPDRDRGHPRPRIPAATRRAPGTLVAAIGVLTSLLATGAAFGVARLVFQNGDRPACSASNPRVFWTLGGRCSSSR